ncbi:MAG: sulfite exporter TauE/SafE family protein, partial [Candidatus Eremiobacteraeota bacterium]|nr:sulfite exporter TauE/SafE family protein [Candidatus Eremiobacteraeota bacterium]
MVGLGGGFIALPVLRLVFHLAPGAAAGASLVFVFANAASASARFASQRRIAFDIAVPMALCAIPTSIAGAYLSARASAATFDTIFAVLLCLVAIDILRRAFVKAPIALPSGGESRPSLWIIVPAGLVVGLVSSLFGIGGGIIVVPVLLYATSKELHVVTATSTAV